MYNKKLPQISSDIPRDLRAFTDRLREIISANGDDRFVTAKELANAGVVKVERSGAVANPSGAVNVPPAPINVTVVGDIQTIVISWNQPKFTGFSHAEVWGNDIDDVNAAHKVGTSPGINYRDPVGPLTSKFYWVRFVNTAGQPGPFASAAGGLGETGALEVYTVDNLKADLAAGAVAVIAGAQNSSSIIKTAPTYMAFQHKDAVLNGTATPYTGDVHTALGITSTGILGGYNDKTTGAWQTTLAIEAGTGNLTVLGTIKADSVIQVGAYLGSQTVGNVLSSITSAYNLAASKLAAQSTYILGSDFALKTASYDAGSGIVITDTGILGKKGGVVTFAIDNTGAATFAGDIITSGRVSLTGAGYTQPDTHYGAFLTGLSSVPINPNVAAVYGRGKALNPFTINVGVWGEIDPNVNGGYGWGVLGVSSGDVLSAGVYGLAGGSAGYAVSGISTGVNGIGVSATSQANGNNGTGTGLYVYGKMRWGPTPSAGNVSISPPDGGTDKYLRNDGVWASVGNLGGGTVAYVGGTGSVNGITLSGAVTTSGNLYLSGSIDITASQVTSGTFPPTRLGSGAGVYYSDGANAVFTMQVVSNVVTNSGTATAISGTIGILGSTYTGIAGAYVNASGNANNVFLNVSATSPSDRRLKEDIADCDLGLAFINSLQPKKYRLKNDPNHQLGYGFIADEVATLGVHGSSLVYHEATWQVGDITGFDTIHYPSYVAVLTKAIQELSAKVHALESANAA